MNGQQYEQLCRRFLAKELGVHVSAVETKHVENPHRPGLPKFKHQIDLYWVTGDAVSEYITIADAKWRSSRKVGKGDVEGLQQVRQDIGAHKAILITNTGFTRGARGAAQHHRIGLHIVRPNFDASEIPDKGCEAIQAKLAQIEHARDSAIFEHHVVYRTFPGGLKLQRPGSGGGGSRSLSTRVAAPGRTRISGPPAGRQAGGGHSTRGGGTAGGKR